MKKIYLILFLCCSFLSANAQNKKELRASLLKLNETILTLKSDSSALENTIAENKITISNSTAEIEKLKGLNKTKDLNLDKLNTLIREKESIIDAHAKSISIKDNTIDSLENSLGYITDSLKKKIKAESTSKWIRSEKWEEFGIGKKENIFGQYMGDCDMDGPETYKIIIRKGYIQIGFSAYGGSIKQMEYNTGNGQIRIKFINDNDMAGDGLPAEFIFSLVDDYASICARMVFFDTNREDWRELCKCTF